MRIIIAIFEDVPFLVLNLFLLLSQPHLANNVVFMVSFVPFKKNNMILGFNSMVLLIVIYYLDTKNA